MMLLKKAPSISKGECPSAYAPIARLLHELPEDALGYVSNKILISILNFVAIEKIAFRKYPALCELEAHYGVNVGTEYTNEQTAKSFCHYIAETRREDLSNHLASAKFFHY